MKNLTRQIQTFRKELPEILSRQPLEHRIKFLDEFIPKIEVKQMRAFAEQLKQAYIAINEK